MLSGWIPFCERRALLLLPGVSVGQHGVAAIHQMLQGSHQEKLTLQETMGKMKHEFVQSPDVPSKLNGVGVAPARISFD